MPATATSNECEGSIFIFLLVMGLQRKLQIWFNPVKNKAYRVIASGDHKGQQVETPCCQTVGARLPIIRTDQYAETGMAFLQQGRQSLGEMLRAPKKDIASITSFCDDNVREQLYPGSYYMPEAPERETCFVAAQQKITSGYMASKSSAGGSTWKPADECQAPFSSGARRTWLAVSRP